MSNPLLERLTRQLSAGGNKDAAGMAHALLLQRGHINKDGSLTTEGKKRSEMGAAGRAIDRAKTYSGNAHKSAEYKYSAETNRATLKKGR